MIARVSTSQRNRWAALVMGAAVLVLFTGCDNATAAVEQVEAGTAKLSSSSDRCRAASAFALSGRVSDFAGMLDRDEEALISQRLASFDARRHHQVVVATVPSLSGKEVREFAQCLGDSWHIGAAPRNDGIVILVAPVERRVGIALGSGWGNNEQDPRAASAISVMTAQFRAGRYVQGLEEGIAELERQLP